MRAEVTGKCCEETLKCVFRYAERKKATTVLRLTHLEDFYCVLLDFVCSRVVQKNAVVSQINYEGDLDSCDGGEVFLNLHRLATHGIL